MKKLNFGDDIVFDEKTHTYLNKKRNIAYLSVTSLIGRKNKFDAPAIAKKVSMNENSQYFGMTVEQILAKWENVSTEGTHLHNSIESFIDKKKLIEEFSDDMIPAIQKFSNLGIKGNLHSEIRVWNHEYELSGTLDIAEERDDCYIIHDIKTNKKVDGATLKKFSIQVNLYAWMLTQLLQESNDHRPVKIGNIIHYEKFVDNKKIDPVLLELPNVENDVEELLLERKKEVIMLNKFFLP